MTKDKIKKKALLNLISLPYICSPINCGIKNIKPIVAKISTNPKVENGNFFFFNKLEYRAQQKTATSIHPLPLLKFKFIILLKSAFEKIIKTPINETIKPKS